MEEKKRCPYCGEEILAVAKKCKHCGEWLNKAEDKAKAMVACPICGEQVEEGTAVCPHCHEHIETVVVTTTPCPICGDPVEEGTAVCPHCHERIGTATPEAAAPSSEPPTPPTPTPPTPPTPVPDDNDDEQTYDEEEDEVKDGFFKYYWGEVCRKHLFDFTGSLGRKDYWCAWLTLTIMQAVGYYVAVIAFSFDSSPGKLIIGIVGLVASIVLSVTQMALAARRLHDLDKSGWWLLVGLIPFAGPIWLLVLLCQAGDTPSARIKANIGDWITGGLLVFMVIMHFAFLGDMINESLDEYDRTEQNYSADDNSYEAEMTDGRLEGLESKTFVCNYGSCSYYLDRSPATLYQYDSDADVTQSFRLGGLSWDDLTPASIIDYAVKDEKIIIICHNNPNAAQGDFAAKGVGALFFDMNDDTFNYIDVGAEIKFESYNTQLKVKKLVGETEDRYLYDDEYYDL